MELSIIMPAYNEEQRIGKTLKDYGSFFSSHLKGKNEILVIVNGSSDKTFYIAQKFSKLYKNIHPLNFPQPIGKGGAIIEGFKRARGKYVCYVDADNATKASHLYELLPYLKDSDAVIASRWMAGSIVKPKQPFKRRIASRCFNMLVRILFNLQFRDTQCGCKLFREQAVQPILQNLGITQWAFDIDLLYHLKSKDFRIIEVPTVWEDIEGSRLKIPKVSREMFLAIVRLRLIYSPFRFIVSLYNKIVTFLISRKKEL